jgi:hypothetical protein
MFSIIALRLGRGWNIASKVAVLQTGGIAEVTDMGRCREKKDDSFTSTLVRTHHCRIRPW